MAKDFSAVEELYRQLIPEDFQSQLCIYVSGERVVDAAHGIDRDAIVPIYSVSKALSAFAFAKIVEEGLIDLDEKVGRYWPEFSSHGKSQVIKQGYLILAAVSQSKKCYQTTMQHNF
jgi:CubicO group peptidase (beta-lactamase class C family)